MAEPTSTDGQGWESFSTDTVSAAGLQSVNVDVEADASIQTESNSSSTASADNVTGDSGAVSKTTFNSGLQSASTVDNSADAGIQGLAGTTAASSASTSDGVANAFTTLADSAGIQDLTRLKVVELTALGQSMNSLSADAESVVGAAIGQSQLSEKVEGLEADNISVSSDAGLQGLAQLDNTADAATSKGASTATADVQALQGSDLNSLTVGGIGSVTGQTSLGNAASSSNVDGGTSQALASLRKPQMASLHQTAMLASAATPHLPASPPLATALAASTASSADADAIANFVDGAQLNTVGNWWWAVPLRSNQFHWFC